MFRVLVGELNVLLESFLLAWRQLRQIELGFAGHDGDIVSWEDSGLEACAPVMPGRLQQSIYSSLLVVESQFEFQDG